MSFFRRFSLLLKKDSVTRANFIPLSSIGEETFDNTESKKQGLDRQRTSCLGSKIGEGTDYYIIIC